MVHDVLSYCVGQAWGSTMVECGGALIRCDSVVDFRGGLSWLRHFYTVQRCTKNELFQKQEGKWGILRFQTLKVSLVSFCVTQRECGA